MKTFFLTMLALVALSVSASVAYASDNEQVSAINKSADKLVVQSEPCLVVISNFSNSADNEGEGPNWSIEEEQATE